MRNLLIIGSVIVLATILSFFGKRIFDNIYVPEIAFEQEKIDFDTLVNQEDASFYFVYQNIGKEDLKIFNIKTSCGCTIPSWNDAFLRPYERDSFKVTYDIINKGYFIKEVMVYSTSKTSPDRLEVMGYVPFE